MVTEMTNRLLAVVVAVAVSATLAAHAAQGPIHQLALVHLGLRLPSATGSLRPTVPAAVPGALETAAVLVTRSARQALDPKADVLSAYERDHDALEHLRQQASALRGPAHPAFNRLLDADQQALATLERRALDYQSGDTTAAVAAMDQEVGQAQAALSAALSAPAREGVRQGRGEAATPARARAGR